MTQYVCDYAWARPDPHAIRAAGFTAVARYLSHDHTGKTLTAAEVAALHSAGLGIVANFEDSAGRAHNGRAAGVADAQFANQLADQLGFPRSCPIYYSVDTDPGAPVNGAIQEYVRGLVSVGIRPVGIYGGDNLVQWALQNGCAYGWWANASSWDHGVKGVGHFHQLYGHPGGTPVIAGVPGNAYDTSVVLNDQFGAWYAGSAPPPPVVNHPGGVPILKTGSRGDAVKLAQQLLVNAGAHIAVDGIFGSGTHTAVVNFQRSHGLAADGIVGPNTWTVLTKVRAPGGSQPAATQNVLAGIAASIAEAKRHTVRRGDSGIRVGWVQYFLRAKHADLPGAVDANMQTAKFGPATEQSVRNFQRAHGLTADGIVGTNTWRELTR